MVRKPRHYLLVISDGGRKKGGDCYGSFSIGGYPGESPLLVSRIALRESTTSTQAEGEILCEAVATAVDGMKSRNLNPKNWGIKIESDSLTLIAKLQSATDAELEKHEKDLERELAAAFEAIDGTEATKNSHTKALERLASGHCMTMYIKRIREMVSPFGEVTYQHVPRVVTKSTFGH